jgi:hypothetical protein
MAAARGAVSVHRSILPPAGKRSPVEARFSLATKQKVQARTVF